MPVFELFGCYHIGDLDPANITILLASTYAIAVLSWRFIERPVRTRAVLQSNRTFLITVAAISTVLLATGAAFWGLSGIPERFSQELVPRQWGPPPGVCIQRTSEQVAAGELCSYGPVTGEAGRALVWGDSHAMVLMPAYQQLARSHQMRIYVAAKSSCLPLLGVSNLTMPAGQREECRRFNAAVVGAIMRLKPDVVLLNARWSVPDRDLLPDLSVQRSEGVSNFQLALEQTLRQAGAGKRFVCAVFDVPAYKYDVPRFLVTAKLRGLSTRALQVSRAEALQQLQGSEEGFRNVEREGRLITVDPKDVLCPNESCSWAGKGGVLYTDANHLSSAGAMLVRSTLEGCFARVLPSHEFSDRANGPAQAGGR